MLMSYFFNFCADLHIEKLVSEIVNSESNDIYRRKGHHCLHHLFFVYTLNIDLQQGGQDHIFPKEMISTPKLCTSDT